MIITFKKWGLKKKFNVNIFNRYIFLKSILCLGIKEENPSIVSCKVTVSYELQKFKEETIPYNKNCYNLGV